MGDAILNMGCEVLYIFPPATLASITGHIRTKRYKANAKIIF